VKEVLSYRFSVFLKITGTLTHRDVSSNRDLFGNAVDKIGKCAVVLFDEKWFA